MGENFESTDVKLNLSDRKFKFRVAGIVEHKDKILIVRMRDNPFYCFPGGHVEILEDTYAAVKRELNEELYFKVNINKLIYIHENFFKEGEKGFHELCFYFKCTPVDNSLNTDSVIWSEIDKGEELTHEFVWVDKNKLSVENVQPKDIVKSFLKDENKFEHLVTRD
ncbi:MAG: NUDIX domain-containing protein [Clostridia bacterium]|nr:NUDIX domain-containing protein [Clostridia bacterium]